MLYTVSAKASIRNESYSWGLLFTYYMTSVITQLAQWWSPADIPVPPLTS